MTNAPNLQNIPIRTPEGRRIRDAFAQARPGGPLANAFVPMTKSAAEEFAALYATENAAGAGHLSTPRTDEDLQGLRAGALAPRLDDAADGAQHVYDDAVHLYGPGYFTCDDCALVRACGYAFDNYNTDGDCLFVK